MARGRVEPDSNFSHTPADDTTWDDTWDSEGTDLGDEYIRDEFPASNGDPAAVEDTEATTVLPRVDDQLPEAGDFDAHFPAEDRYAHTPEYRDFPVEDQYTYAQDPHLGRPGTQDAVDDGMYEQPHEPANDAFATDSYLRTPQKPTRTAAARRRTRVMAGISVGVVAVGVVAVVAIRGEGGSADNSASSGVSTTAAVATTKPSTPSTVASAPGPGDTTTGPGVILGFDDAYYGQRNGGAAAAYLVASQNNPATAQAIQADIDRLDPNVKHNLIVTSTEAENVYNVRLTLTTPDGLSHEYHQQYTVVSSGGRFYIANKLNCDSVCPTP